jgi:glycosyl transferase family 9 (putative heptosyltransferase)
MASLRYFGVDDHRENRFEGHYDDRHPAKRAKLPRQLSISDRFQLLSKQLPLDDFFALPSFCTVFVGNDSGPSHLASLRDTNVVNLFMARHNWNEWEHENQGYTISGRVLCAGCQQRAAPRDSLGNAVVGDHESAGLGLREMVEEDRRHLAPAKLPCRQDLAVPGDNPQRPVDEDRDIEAETPMLGRICCGLCERGLAGSAGNTSIRRQTTASGGLEAAILLSA